MTTIAALQAGVERRYALLDAPAWPDPHADRDVDPEEYSRVTDPERYGIIPLRARVWREVLADAGATVTSIADAPDEIETVLGPARPDRVLRVDPPPSADGALPLYFLERDATTEKDFVAAALALSIGSPEWPMLRQPDCGCDACDGGSADYLTAVEEGITQALDHTVMLRGRNRRGLRRAENEWSVFWAGEPMAARGSGFLPLDDYVDVCARLARGEDVALPSGTRVQVGQPWFPTTDGTFSAHGASTAA